MILEKLKDKYAIDKQNRKIVLTKFINKNNYLYILVFYY